MESLQELFRIGYGPSSSHTIAPHRAAVLFIVHYPDATSYRLDLYGSLALTSLGHGTADTVQKTFGKRRLEITEHPDDVLPEHPNGMIFHALDSDGSPLASWPVFSVGGGALSDNGLILKKPQRCYPFISMSEMLAYCDREACAIHELPGIFEEEGSNDFLRMVWKTMQTAVRRGIKTEGLLPGPLKIRRKAAAYYTKAKASRGSMNDIGMIFSFALAVSEENAAGGTVVTAPTCGACGVVPAVLMFLRDDQKFSEAAVLRGLATAGMIGNLIKTNGSVSGAEVGCQGEIGSACAMAAAAAAQVMGGSNRQIEYAAEMALEHNLGLTCDPVAGYVQIPCIERNAIAAGKALECAVYALFSDGAHKVSFDTAVITMLETGKDLQAAYRETGKGGLARNWHQL